MLVHNVVIIVVVGADGSSGAGGAGGTGGAGGVAYANFSTATHLRTRRNCSAS